MKDKFKEKKWKKTGDRKRTGQTGSKRGRNKMENITDRLGETPDSSYMYSMETTPDNSYLAANRSEWTENVLENVGNISILNMTFSLDNKGEIGFIVSNIQLLNAIVLAIAVTLMILFICTFVLKVFSRYHDDESMKDDGGTMYYA